MFVELHWGTVEFSVENGSRWQEFVLEVKVIAYLSHTSVTIGCQKHGPDGLKMFQLKQVHDSSSPTIVHPLS